MHALTAWDLKLQVYLVHQLLCNGKQSTVNKSLDGSMYPG